MSIEIIVSIGVLVCMSNTYGYVLMNRTITDRYGFDYGGNQLLECFESSNGWGATSFKIENNMNNFWSSGWDNKFSSCCFTGFWFLYQDANYNRDSPNVNIEKEILYYTF